MPRYFAPEMVDYNQLPFRSRFNNCYKTFSDVLDLLEQLETVIEKLFQKLQNKSKMQNILEENFDYIGQCLKSAHGYLNSGQCELEQENRTHFIKILEEKLKSYAEDQQEYSNLRDVREIAVMIDQLPATWRCATWKNLDNPRDYETNSPKPLYTTSSYNPTETRYETDSELSNTYRLLRLCETKIEFLKQKDSLLDEIIIMLFNSSKEYLKTLLKLETKLANIAYSMPETEAIRNEILAAFGISDQIDFFSPSVDAYRICASPQIVLTLELKHNQNE